MPFWDALMQGKADFSPTLLLKVGRLHSLGTFITPHVQNMNERKCLCYLQSDWSNESVDAAEMTEP